MRRARLTSVSILGIVFVLAIAMVVLVTADLGVFAPRIERYLSHRLGRDVAIDGDLSLLLGGRISVVADDVRIGAPDWSKESDFARAEHLEFDVAARSLWSGPIDIQRLSINGLRLHLERADNGDDNWTFGEDDDEPDDELPVIVRDMSLQDALLTYDGPSDMPTLRLALSRLDGTERDDGDLEFSSAGQLNDTDLSLHAEIGPTENLISLENTTFSLDGSLGEIDVSGNVQIDDLLRPRQPRGTVTVRGPNAEYLTGILGLRDITTGSLHLDVSIKPSGDQLAALVRGTFGEFDIDASGSFVELDDLDNFNLSLRTAGPDAGAVARLAGLEEMPSQAFTVDAQISSENGELVIDRIDADVGDTSLDVTAQFPEFPSPGGGVAQLKLMGPELGEYSHLLGLPGTLTGPFEVAADLEELPGPIETVDLGLPHVAVTTVDLDRVVEDLHAVRGRVQRRGRRELVDVAAPAPALLEVVAAGDRGVGQHAHALQHRIHVGQLRLDHLEARDGPPELLALPGVVDRQLQRALGHADTERRDQGTFEVEASHDDRDTLVLDVEQVLRRHAAVVEDQLGRRAAPETHLGELLGDRETRAVTLDDERRDALRTGRGVRLRVDQHDVRDGPVRDVELAPVQDPLVAVAARGRAHALQRV